MRSDSSAVKAVESIGHGFGSSSESSFFDNFRSKIFDLELIFIRIIFSERKLIALTLRVVTRVASSDVNRNRQREW